MNKEIEQMNNEELIDSIISNSLIGGREEEMMGDLYSEKNELYKKELLKRLSNNKENIEYISKTEIKSFIEENIIKANDGRILLLEITKFVKHFKL